MNILYYGSGVCTIEGSEIKGIELRYSGTVAITKTCGDNCLFMAKNNGIIIASLDNVYLTNLFSYKGEIKIKSVIAANKNGKRVPCSIKKVMDYSELLNSNAEDMTTKSEELSAGHQYKGKVKKTSISGHNIIGNQHSKNEFYLEDGTPYSGLYHVHVNTGKTMTGAEHSEASQLLYYKKTKRDGSVIDNLIEIKYSGER